MKCPVATESRWCAVDVADAPDKALMESATGLYKTELIKPCGPWRKLSDVEPATKININPTPGSTKLKPL
jgi:hypothetical protein